MSQGGNDFIQWFGVDETTEVKIFFWCKPTQAFELGSGTADKKREEEVWNTSVDKVNQVVSVDQQVLGSR